MKRNFLPLMTLPLMLIACGGDTKTYTDEEGNKVEVTQKGDGDEVNMNVSSKDGDMSIKAGDAVDANAKLPYDLPLIGDSKIAAQMNASDESGETGAMVTLVTDKSAQEAFDFYKKALTDSGFKVESEMSTNDMRMLAGEKDDKSGVAITITKGQDENAGKTSVMIFAGKQ
jgi:hypothetical protein